MIAKLKEIFSNPLMIGYVVFFAFVLFGFIRQEQTINKLDESITQQKIQAEQIIESGIGNCERQNIVREAVISQILFQIETSHALSPKLFPTIPKDVYDDLLREQNQNRRETIEALTPVDCPAIYDAILRVHP